MLGNRISWKGLLISSVVLFSIIPESQQQGGQTPGPGDILQQTLDNLRRDVQALRQENSNQNQRILALESKVDTLDAAIVTDVLPGLESLDTRVEKLDAINKKWKNNFKIVNSTFTALRRKVGIRNQVFITL